MSTRKYLTFYILSLAGCFCLALFASSRLVDFRSEPLNFRSMSRDCRVVTSGLTRKQYSEIKLGYIEHHAPPEIGLFGNHQFQFFSADAFGNLPEGAFFNFWYANLALPEIYDYLYYLESIHKLPTQTILVQITTPNNDGGNNIITYNYELPQDLIYASEKGALKRFHPVALGKMAYMRFQDWIKDITDYSHVLVGLIAQNKNVVVDKSLCEGPESDRRSDPAGIIGKVSKFLPLTIRRTVLPEDAVLCNKWLYHRSFRFDGSCLSAEMLNGESLEMDENSLERVHLKAGDEQVIARYMAQIHALGARNGLKVVFIIPPVYESERFSIVDQIVDKALAMAPDVQVVDHRKVTQPRDFFSSYDHPHENYFRFLTQVLEEKGYVNPTALSRNKKQAGQEGLG